MNTVAHLVFNLLTIERPHLFYPWPSFLRKNSLPIAPIVWGALIPDLPMVVFYGVEKLWLGQSEDYIWGSAYFLPHWSNFIDVFNSIPLIGLGFIWSFWQQSRWGWLLCMSLLLHVLGDLPLHHDDGHRHFFPISNWRFESPISYWDPNHHGGLIAVIEAIAVFMACFLLFRSYQSPWGKAVMALFMGLDLLVLIILVSRVF